MKKYLIIAILFATCNKQDKELATPQPESRTIEKTDCSKFLPVDTSKIPARRPIKGPTYTVTATALNSYFDGSATVALTYRVKGNTSVTIVRINMNDGTRHTITTSNKTQYNDATARASTTYIYVVNGISSNQVTTFDAPIVGGNEEKPVVYLNPHGGLVTNWGTWVSYVGPTGWGGVNALRDVYDREINQKYSLGLIITTDSNVYNATHYTKRIQIFLTDDYQWYGNTAGGVAWIGSFGKEQPAFIFPILLYYDDNYVTFATGHEGGHTKGLWHAVDDCTQAYGSSANWMAGNYGFTAEQRFIGESVLSKVDQSCFSMNQILTAKNTIGQ